MKYSLVIAAFLAYSVTAYNPERSATYLEEDGKKDDGKKDDGKKDDGKKDDGKKDDGKKDDAAACKVAKFEFFSDKACSADKTVKEDADAAKTAKTAWEDSAKAADGKCNAKTTVVCDGTGITTSKFSDDDCKTADGEPTVMKWGECTQVTENALYVKMTGAKALMATAAAALAFVGS